MTTDQKINRFMALILFINVVGFLWTFLHNHR